MTSKEYNLFKESKRGVMRLTKRCNNFCIFCLDGDNRSNEILGFDEIKENIDSMSEHITKIILTGGEPTIHPDFLKIVAYCKSKNILEIQVITNGRMFSYKEFTEKAKNAGLTEATISIHGHNKEIHDSLTNTPGAFEQAIKGIENLKKTDILVNINSGIFKSNYKNLKDIVELTHNLGLDLINLMGIELRGMALKNKEVIFIDGKSIEPYLREAIELIKKYGMNCFILRVPMRFLYGFEEYVENTDKINEVSIEKEQFFSTIPAKCKGEFCEFCNLNNVCRSIEQIKRCLDSKDKGNVRLIIDSENRSIPIEWNIDEIVFDSKISAIGLDRYDKVTIVNHPERYVSLSCTSHKDGRLETTLEIDINNENKNIILEIINRYVCDKIVLVWKNPGYKIKEYANRFVDEDGFTFNLFDIEKDILEINKNAKIFLKNIPPCVFSSEFISEMESRFLTDEFLTDLNLSSIVRNSIGIREFSDSVYSGRHKEWITECESCRFNRICAGFFHKYLKIYHYDKDKVLSNLSIKKKHL